MIRDLEEHLQKHAPDCAERFGWRGCREAPGWIDILTALKNGGTEVKYFLLC